jgi:hypothetical protein
MATCVDLNKKIYKLKKLFLKIKFQKRKGMAAGWVATTLEVA